MVIPSKINASKLLRLEVSLEIACKRTIDDEERRSVDDMRSTNGRVGV